MKLFDLIHRTFPSSALGKGVGNIYYRISGTIGGGYLGLPVLKAHSEAALIYVHEPLLLQSFLIYKPRTALYAVHELGDTLAYMFHRLTENSFQFSFELRRAGEHGNQETHDVHYYFSS